MLLYPLRGLEQMAMAEMGWEVFLRLTQVSGTARVGVPCQLRCKEDCRLSVRSSLTPRSFSSGPQVVVILILPAGTEIKKSHIGLAFANLGMTCIFWVTDANTDCAKYIQAPPRLRHTHKTNMSSYQKDWIDWFPMTSIATDMTMPKATCHTWPLESTSDKPTVPLLYRTFVITWLTFRCSLV